MSTENINAQNGIIYPAGIVPIPMVNYTEEEAQKATKSLAGGTLAFLKNLPRSELIKDTAKASGKTINYVTKVTDIFNTIVDGINENRNANTILSDTVNKFVSSGLEGMAKASITDYMIMLAKGKNVASLTPIGTYSVLATFILSLSIEINRDLHSKGISFTGHGSIPFDMTKLYSTETQYKEMIDDKSNGYPDPIVVQLPGGSPGGFDTVSLEESNAYFDLNASGKTSEKTGWVGRNAGILVKTSDGVVSDGTEVFGDQTIMSNGQKASNGYQALAEYDTNKDGNLTAEEANAAGIQVWVDNGNAKTEEGELKSLSDLGIKSISLDTVDVNTTDGKGNIIEKVSKVEFEDGKVTQAGQFRFATDTLISLI